MRNADLFFNTDSVKMDFAQLLSKVQEHISVQCSDLQNDDPDQKRYQMQRYIKKYLQDHQYGVEGMDFDELVQKLYQEMAEYSFLTPYLNFTIKGVEGIEIDAFDSVRIKHTGGIWERSKEHFLSPEYAGNVMKRLLHQSGITMDNSKPLARGHLGDKTRITVIGDSILDKNVGIAASIRFVNPSNLKKDDLISFGTATEEMLDFLSTAYRYGASMLLAGETDAGKTTLMSIIMSALPDSKKLYTIENGTREFNLVKRDESGNVINSVIHTVTRESTDPATAVTQQMLLEHGMTMNPDYICMAEIKGSEAFESIEAALTGHPVIGTTHTGCCRDIPDRLVQLASYRASGLSDKTLMRLAVKAFPILFYAEKCEDNTRRITEICECRMAEGVPTFRTLWEYVTVENKIVNGKTVINGYFKKTGTISPELQARLRHKGIPENILQKYLEGADQDDAHKINSISRHVSRGADTSESVAV